MNSFWRVVLIFLLMLPLVAVFLLPEAGVRISGLWFWLALMICFLALWLLVGQPRPPKAQPPPLPRMLYEQEQPPAVRQVMDVRLAVQEGDVQVFRGPLMAAPQDIYQLLKREIGDRTPLVQEDPQLGGSIVLMPREESTVSAPARPRWHIHVLLFAATFLTTVWAGARHQGVNLLQEPGQFMVGLPYAVGLLLILALHELGHFFTAKKHGMDVTPPYFIPVPFGLGTFGAFISMRSPSEDRKALFDVAIAGPLAGLVVAIPALFLGLRSSEVLIGPAGGFLGGGVSAGSSMLLALVAKLSLGDLLSEGHVLRLSPLAFAGWLGLFITALNLLPIGQLDGGHIARAMFGHRVGSVISNLSMWTLFLLALFVWPWLMTWAIIVFFIAGRATPPLNDLTPISLARRILGYFAFLILILILAPLPHLM